MARFDRRQSFQQLHAEEAPEPVPWQAGGDGAEMDNILRARHTGRFAPGFAPPTIPEHGEDDGDDDGFVDGGDLRVHSRSSLTRFPEDDGAAEDAFVRSGSAAAALRLAAAGGAARRAVEDRAFEFYSYSPETTWDARRGGAGAPPSEEEEGGGADDGVLVLDMKSLNLPPVSKLKSLGHAEPDLDPFDSGTPGLEVFGEVPTPAASRGGAQGSTAAATAAKPGMLPDLDVIYRMAVRAVMLPWEAPERNIVQRLQLADLLRVAFRVDRREHLEVMQWAMECNSHAAAELGERLEQVAAVNEAFLEVEARSKWEADETSELRRLLGLQKALPSFNALLELAVLEGKNLKPKKTPAVRLGSSSSPKHFAVLDVGLVKDKHAATDKALGPVRTRNARGQSPRWNAKSTPRFLSSQPESIAVSVCLGGMFEDHAEEETILARAVPLMTQLHADTLSSIGQKTLGNGEVSLCTPDGAPEDAYLLPATKTVALWKESRGLFKGGASKKSSPLSRSPSTKKAKEVGAARIVVRYVPETRVQSSSRSASKAAHEPIVAYREMAGHYEYLISHLWDCWENDVRLPTHRGHTYTIDQTSGDKVNPETMATIVLRRDDRSQTEPPQSSFSHTGTFLARALSDFVSVGRSRGPDTVLLEDLEDDDFTPRYCPGEPWTQILDAVRKLYRVRWPWHQLLLVGRILKDWHLEPAYLTALQQAWQPVVELARDGMLSRREVRLHVSCTRQIVQNCISAIETYNTSFGRLSSTAETVEGLRILVALTGLAIRYDTCVDSLVEPLKIHVRRNVRREMRMALPTASMNREECLIALGEAIHLATRGLERDLELVLGFPDSLDLPYFTARLRYKMLSDHMFQMFAGLGVVAYDKQVMEIQDQMKELHRVMIEANISLVKDADANGDLSFVVLLDVDRLLGRSLLKWIRDIGLNVMDWMDSAVKMDKAEGWKPASGSVAYSSSVVELFKIFTGLIDNVHERMPEPEMQTALHSEVLERLQAAVHHVFRRYVRVLEGFCTDLIAGITAKRERQLHEILDADEVAAGDPSKASASEEPCITQPICALLNNIWALNDGLGDIQDKLERAVCSLSDLPDSDMDTGHNSDDDTLSELSFMSEEEDMEPEDALRRTSRSPAASDFVNPSDNAEFFMSVKNINPGEPQLERFVSTGQSVASLAADASRLMIHRRRAWQRHCGSNEAVLALAEANCNTRMANAFKVKLLVDIARLLRAEQGRAEALDIASGRGSPKTPSRSKSKKSVVSKDEAFSRLKEIDYHAFMEAILSKELSLMSEHMSRGSFHQAISTAWVALVSAMEDVVLGTSGLVSAVTYREVQTIRNLLDAALDWFHCDGEGVDKAELLAATTRLEALIGLHSQPMSTIEVKYNDTWAEIESMSRRGRLVHSAAETQRRRRHHHRQAPFVERHCKEVKHGPGLFNLLCLLRQRASADPAAAELVNKIIKHAESSPMEVVFSRREEVADRWPCVYTANRAAPGHLCITRRHVAFAAVGADPMGLRDARVLIDLSLVSRMDLAYESHTQLLTFTMQDKATHSFCGSTGKAFAARGQIYKAVAAVVAGSGSTLERSLRGEGGTAAAASLNLPSDEEIFHSMECARLRGSCLWSTRGVLYVCKSFVMFDRPGKERIKVAYSEVTDQKLVEGYSWLCSGGVGGDLGGGDRCPLNLVLRTSNAAVGTLTFCNMALQDVTLCMTSIAAQVAEANEYKTAARRGSPAAAAARASPRRPTR